MANRSKKKQRQPKSESPGAVKSKEIPSILPHRAVWPIVLPTLAIVAAILFIYGPVLHGGWLWDDDLYFAGNPLLRDPDRIWKAWFEPGSFIDYYPILETVEWFQWQLWGMDTLGYHLTSLALHLVSALLVWRLLSKFGLRLAWLGGLIFAVHPVQVESVAWIVELKNTLSLPPFLLALCAWIDYREHGKPRDYLLAVALFLFAMLCKITMAPFPATILLYEWWKRGSLGGKLVLSSLPFCLISLLLGFTEVWVGQVYLQNNHGTPDPSPIGNVFSHLACAGSTLWFYFTQYLLPIDVMPIYPHWTVDPPSPLQFVPWLLLGGVVAWSWTARRRWGRHVLLGIGFFVLFLAPFLGFFAVSFMSFTWVMDHFLYLPIIGLIGLTVAGLDCLEMKLPSPLRPYAIGLVTALLALLTYKSYRYAGMFLDSETLWTYELRQNPDAWPAYNILGNLQERQGQLPQAMDFYARALQIKPNYAEARYNLANVLREAGRLDEAAEQYRQAFTLRPNHGKAHNNLGIILAQQSRFAEAADQFRLALQTLPDNAEVHDNLGFCLERLGRSTEALDEYRQALRLDPNSTAARTNLDHLQSVHTPTPSP